MFNTNENVLVVVKAYPNPSTKYGETVCVAGIVPNKGFIRLYPINFRTLSKNKQFDKYDIINVDIEKHDDGRPESYKPILKSIKIIGSLKTRHDKSWSNRKNIVLEFLDESMCSIQKQQKTTRKSLGIFKPKEINELLIINDDVGSASLKKSLYDQLSMFDKKLKPLDDVPYIFKFKYKCFDDDCKGHKQSLIDWEIFELYRNIIRKHGIDKKIIKDKIKEKYFNELFSDKRDFYFYTGNQFLHPTSFILLGVFWPPKVNGTQLSLGNGINL